jgi:hypothetical protein
MEIYMNEQVESYLTKRKKEIEEEKREKRSAHLKSLGLTTRIYTDEAGYNDEFPRYDNKEKKHYKLIALDVTDDEYEEICKHDTNNKHTVEYEASNIVTVLNVIAVIIIVGGIIAGFVMGYQGAEYRSNNEFQMKVAFIWWAYSIVIGVVLLGFSKIINLLEKIDHKLSDK